MFAELKDPVRRKIEQYEQGAVPAGHFFPSVHAAQDAFRAGTANASTPMTERPNFADGES